MAQYKLVRCRINGRDTETMVDVRASLTDLLRNRFVLISSLTGTNLFAPSTSISRLAAISPIYCFGT